MPNEDAIAREYINFSDEHGWRLPSLPARIGQQFGWPAPKSPKVLINWRGPPFTYKFISFADVFIDLASEKKQRPQDEFTNKIVIIGSTAPSLFDIKATPLSPMHPGVEVLATAIDSFKNDDYLRVPDAAVAYLLLALLIIWATAWGFFRSMGRRQMNSLFGASQFMLVGISYASINLSDVYINLTGPVSFALAYFAIARTYYEATARLLDQTALRATQVQQGQSAATLLLIRLDTLILTASELEKVRVALLSMGAEFKSVEVISGTQAGLWSLVERCYAVCWLAPPDDTAAAEPIAKEVDAVTAAVPGLPSKYLVQAQGVPTWTVHRGPIAGGCAAPASWRVLLGRALAQTEQLQQEEALP